MIDDIEFVEQVWWFTSRSAGIVAWILLSFSVIAGMSISHRRVGSRRTAGVLPAGWPLDLHRFSSSLALVFLAIHLVALVPDNFVHFSWAELFIPLQSSWQPWAVAWGIVAFWLVLAVEISSLLRHRLSHRVWRVIHTASFAVWIAATVHLLMAGTDASHPVFRIAQIVVIALVVALMLVRITRLVANRSGRTNSSARSRALTIEEAVDIDEVDARKGREFSA